MKTHLNSVVMIALVICFVYPSQITRAASDGASVAENAGYETTTSADLDRQNSVTAQQIEAIKTGDYVRIDIIEYTDPQMEPSVTFTPGPSAKRSAVSTLQEQFRHRSPVDTNSANCYSLFPFSWKPEDLPLQYVINPDNNQNLSIDFIVKSIRMAALTWDRTSPTKLFSNKLSIDNSTTLPYPDGKNNIAFYDFGGPGVAAQISIFLKEDQNQTLYLSGFDVLFNTAIPWGDATSNPAVLDLRDVAAHELGHSLGLADLYEPRCMDATMFYSIAMGETSKRTLSLGDRMGIRVLYGSPGRGRLFGTGD